MGLHHNPTAGIRPTGLLAITYSGFYFVSLFPFSSIHHFLPFHMQFSVFESNLRHFHSFVIPPHSPLIPSLYLCRPPHPSFMSALITLSFSIPPSCSTFVRQLYFCSHLSLPCVIFLFIPVLTPPWHPIALVGDPRSLCMQVWYHRGVPAHGRWCWA